jgi:L-aspartate oxidase
VDFAVIGSGIAGLSYALDAAEVGDVAVITKASAFEASTSYAQGGISAVVDKLDSVDEHVRDTCVAGGYLCDERAVRVMVEDSRAAVETLIERGTRFTRRASDGALHLAREGGHSRHRIVHADDMTGKEIERALLEAARAHPRITFYEHHFAMELLKTRDVGGEEEPRCSGVLAVDKATGTTKAFVASSTVLACGGAGHLFPSTTNPVVSTGDGVAMAMRVGATVANMEFMQFHPTSLFTGKGGAAKLEANENAFLITEAVRGHGGQLYNALGERFMSRYDAREELAPRDIVARSIDSEMKRTKSNCVYLDITHVSADEIRANFPGVAAELAKRGLDMTTERIPVVPAAHYMCGGVSTNENGETSLRGLFACGEVAYTGVHGANRLASNSLLEGVVFARRAVASVTDKISALRAELPALDVDEDELRRWLDKECLALTRACAPNRAFVANDDAWERDIRAEIQRTMWNAAGIVRSTVEMEDALRTLQTLSRACEERASVCSGYTMGTAEISNLIVVGRLMLRCALMRKESRGLHYTLDYPEPVDDEKKPSFIIEDVAADAAEREQRAAPSAPR